MTQVIFNRLSRLSSSFIWTCFMWEVSCSAFDGCPPPVLSSSLQGEINGHRGLVPSNFLEEVPDDVEVYLTDTPPRGGPQAEPEAEAAPPSAAPAQAEAKRVHPSSSSSSSHRRCQR